MIRIAILFMAVLATLALAIEPPIPGYKVEEITWPVEAFDNGTYVNITGTIENVVSELTKINPDFPKNTASNFAVVKTEQTLGPSCGPGPWGWLACEKRYVSDGVNYLRTVKGKAVQSPGPGACARVSCSYNAAIWWCNDNKNTFTLDSFDIIANCGQVLINECTTQLKTLGQNFNGNNWNCIVRWDADNC